MVKAIRPNAPGRGQDMQWTGVRAGHTETLRGCSGILRVKMGAGD